MTFEDFVGQVQHRARLGTEGEAVRAVCATLETLGERLFNGEADHLAAQLPSGINAYLRLAKKKESFSLDEFFQRVADRQGAGVDLPQAIFHARVVMEVLQEAVSPGQINDVRAQLPNEFDPIFEAGSTGELTRE
jgi:uncharacterized protein (DUF2267 family)